jgi:hypothetical protein
LVQQTSANTLEAGSDSRRMRLATYYASGAGILVLLAWLVGTWGICGIM